jgi:hypothetical protein
MFDSPLAATCAQFARTSSVESGAVITMAFGMHLAFIVGIEPAIKPPLDLAYRALAVQALISRGLGVSVVALRMQLWGTAGGAEEVWRDPISDDKVSTTKHWTTKHVLRAVSRVYKLRAASAVYYY